jgi:mannose-6-phosphate isomerase-like protein (cupin superfamily)
MIVGRRRNVLRQPQPCKKTVKTWIYFDKDSAVGHPNADKWLPLEYNHDSGINTQYMISGRIKVVMDDGTEEEFGPGDAAVIPPGHNAWVIGNEPVVGIDFTGLKDYAKS